MVFTRRNWIFVPMKSQHSDIYGNFTHNCSNSEAIMCPSVGKWINVQPNIGLLFSAKKKRAIKPWKDMKKHVCMLPIKETKWKEYVHTIPTTWNSGKSKNFIDSKKSRCFPGVGREGWIGRAKWTLGYWNTLLLWSLQ